MTNLYLDKSIKLLNFQQKKVKQINEKFSRMFLISFGGKFVENPLFKFLDLTVRNHHKINWKVPTSFYRRLSQRFLWFWHRFRSTFLQFQRKRNVQMKHKCKLHSLSLFTLWIFIQKLKENCISSESFIQSHPLIHPSPKNVGEFFSVFQEKKKRKNEEW